MKKPQNKLKKTERELTKIQGDWFRARLHHLRKSQAGLARHIDADKATVNHMLTGKRRMPLEEVEGIAAFLDVSVIEVLERAGLNVSAKDSGKVIELRRSLEEDTQDQNIQWSIPVDYVQGELRAKVKNVQIIEAVGDSLKPTICNGDRVMIDISRTSPSPAGLFAINDGFGVVIKRIAPIIQSDPPSLRVSSDAEEGHDLVQAASIKVLGRVLAVLHKF